MSLENTRFVIIGASGCIGSALSRRLKSHRAQPILLGRSAAKLALLGEELGAQTHALDAIESRGVGACRCGLRPNKRNRDLRWKHSPQASTLDHRGGVEPDHPDQPNDSQRNGESQCQGASVDRRIDCVVRDQRLADTSNLYIKQAHWNAKGLNFFQLHELFDDLAGGVFPFIDMIAERATALGA